MEYDKPNKTAHSLTWLIHFVIHSYMKQNFNTDVGCDTILNGNIWDTGCTWMNNQDCEICYTRVMMGSGWIIVFTLR